MGALGVAFGRDLMLGERRATAWAPGQHIMAPVEPAMGMAQLQKAPDAIVVLVGMRIIALLPVHPVAEPLALCGLDCRKVGHTLLAALDEGRDAVGFDLALAGEAQVLFDIDLYPESLAVKALLPAQLLSQHAMVAVIQIFQRAPPGVMHAHGVICGDGAINERPPGATTRLGPHLLEDLLCSPQAQDAILKREIGWSHWHVREHTLPPQWLVHTGIDCVHTPGHHTGTTKNPAPATGTRQQAPRYHPH